MSYRSKVTGLVVVCLVLSALVTEEVRAQTPSPNLVTPAELEAYREWVWSLPPNPNPPLPLPTGVTTFRWDQVEEPDPNNPNATIVVDYTTPSYTQTGGTCFLFAVVGALEIQASIDSNSWWNWGSETHRGVRLSSLNGWKCNHYVGSFSGVANEMLHWSQYHGIPEDCFDPYVAPLPAYGLPFEDRPPCHNCDQYLGPQASIPTTCSPWQHADNQVLYYRHSGPVPVDVVGDKSRTDLEKLAAAIYEGPVVENTNCNISISPGALSDVGRLAFWCGAIL